MDRRQIFKVALLAPFVGLFKKKDQRAIYGPDTSVQKILTFEDEIVSSSIFKGRLIVATKRDLWEIIITDKSIERRYISEA